MEENKRIEEDEIDLMALLQTLWKGKKTILKFVLVFGIIGLFIALFSPKEYTATTVMVPTVIKGSSSSGGVGSLAALAGISLNSNIVEGTVPPSLYPKILRGVPFKKSMLDTELKISHLEEPVTFRKYYEDIYSGGVLSVMKKYTIGLPSLIIGAIRGKGNDKEVVSVRKDSLLYVTAKEKGLFGVLSDGLSVEVNDKEGYVSLSAKMPEALAAAQLAKKAQYLLQTYIIEFKSKKAKEQLEFIEGRLKEKEREFRKVELALAQFQDRNRNVATAIARTQEQHLQSEYNLAFGIYSELAKQVESQKIKVKEDTPVFTIIEPVSVPIGKSKPKRAMILVIWIFLGIVVGIGVVFGREWIKKFKEEKKI